MSAQLIICPVIFVLTCAGYMTGVWSLGTVAIDLPGCLRSSLHDGLRRIDQASPVKGGWVYAIISCVVSMGWIMTMYPVL